MMKPLLMVQESDSRVLGVMWHDDPDAGPVKPQAEAPQGVRLVAYAGEFSREGREDWDAHLLDEEVVWSDPLPIEQRRSVAIDAIDSTCEDLRLAVVSKMTQTEEYKLAEQHAREYRAAGYTGEAGRGVTGWTRAKHRQGWTDRDAADDILATADRWYDLLFDIRDARLAAKEDVRHETDVAAIGAIVAGVQARMEALALQMNTTTTE